MKKIRTWFRKPVVTIAALLAAAGLLAFSGISATQARLNYESDEYISEVSMQDIGVSLLEDGKEVASRDYSETMAARDYSISWGDRASGKLALAGVPEKPVLNQKYDEEITVQNTNRIDEYVRVTIYRYWTDEEGKKQTDLDPSLIQLFLNEQNLADATGAVGSWYKDAKAGTKERMVFYYTKKLEAGGTTAPVIDQICISNEVAKKVSQETSGNTVKTTYDYDGKDFCIEIAADAVQAHNGRDAIISAWGVDPGTVGVNVE